MNFELLYVQTNIPVSFASKSYQYLSYKSLPWTKYYAKCQYISSNIFDKIWVSVFVIVLAIVEMTVLEELRYNDATYGTFNKK